MAIDIKKLNTAQLNDLKRKIDARQGEIRKASVTQLRAKVAALVKSEGFTMEELFGGRGKGKRGGKRGPVPPKYRNPANAAQTWSGRGKRPTWFVSALKGGKKEKDLLIK
jgi:DNA-binding protein H-NS